MHTDGNTHRACVLTPGAAFYGNGSMTSIRPGVHADLAAILAGVPGRFVKHATIVIDGAQLVELAAHEPAVRAAGWSFSRIGAWTLFHREDGRTVAVGCRDAMMPRHYGVLLNADTDPGVLAMLLDKYNEVTGLSWRGTCATTALNAIRLSWENTKYQPRWNHAKVGPGYAMGPLIWSREPNRWEREWRYAHTFDASSAYLGSAGNAMLAWSVLDHTGPREFSKSAPGYWRVAVNAAVGAWGRDRDRPPLLVPGRVLDDTVWVTTPYAELLEAIGGPLRVVESWTATDGRRTAGHRVLRSWAEQLRDARTRVEQLPAGTLREILRKAVKRTYKDATGGMQREGMRVYRPDWAHTLIDLWRATLIRRLIEVRESQGLWPIAVKTDSVTYADDAMPMRPGHSEFTTFGEVLRVRGCQVERCGCAPRELVQLGAYKHEATVPLGEWAEARQRKGKR